MSDQAARPTGLGRIEGKVAIVTGAGSGIGRASAELFAREGAKVICADISGKEEEVAAAIGTSAIPVHVDVARSQDVARMIDTAVQGFGQLDILFNNAGIGSRGLAMVPDIDEETFDLQIAIHLKGVFFGMKYGIPVMLSNGGGSIINTASAAGLVGFQGLSLYSAAKGGVVLLTKSTALDYAQSGIRINAICPGMVYTGMSEARGMAPDMPRPEQPMNRYGRAEELAAAALFLASDESSFITGAAIPVDGGYVAR
jgi:NAD(P)-dependent dehydrogenase (short-subunit alcohol dehydrogenase family)